MDSRTKGIGMNPDPNLEHIFDHTPISGIQELSAKFDEIFNYSVNNGVSAVHLYTMLMFYVYQTMKSIKDEAEARMAIKNTTTGQVTQPAQSPDGEC